MSIRDRVKELRSKLRSAAVEAYNEADGDIEAAMKILKKRRVAYGFDIATAMLLFQLAMMLYKWAKENGYLTELSVVAQEGEPSFLSEDCFDDE
jgi:hypothetical protein